MIIGVGENDAKGRSKTICYYLNFARINNHALIAHAAYKTNVDKLLTLNQSHFKRVYPAIASIIEEPT